MEKTSLTHQHEIIQDKNDLSRRKKLNRVPMEMLRGIDESASITDNYSSILNLIFDVPGIFLKKIGCVFLADADSSTLRMVCGSENISKQLRDKCKSIKYGECHCGVAANTRDIVFSGAIDERHTVTYEGIEPHGHYCVPFPLDKNEPLLGVLNLYTKPGHEKSEDEVEFLTSVADILTMITRRKLDQDKGSIRLYNTLRTFSEMAECPPSSKGHQWRVSRLATAIAERLGLDESEKRQVGIASFLHDIGQIKVPREILMLKSEDRTEAQRLCFQEHTVLGEEIITDLGFDSGISSCIRQHHERLDGSGYPDELEGEQILLGAQIIGISDEVEYFSNIEPFKPDNLQKALVNIDSNEIPLFSPEVIEACRHVLAQDRYPILLNLDKLF